MNNAATASGLKISSVLINSNPGRVMAFVVQPSTVAALHDSQDATGPIVVKLTADTDSVVYHTDSGVVYNNGLYLEIISGTNGAEAYYVIS